MGHKGVSKRKPSQTKTAPLTKDNASSVTSVLKETKNQAPAPDRKKKP